LLPSYKQSYNWEINAQEFMLNPNFLFIALLASVIATGFVAQYKWSYSWERNALELIAISS
jgi:hypothetical protein